MLTAENYYSVPANQIYMSVSQFKDFQKCESMAMAKINGTWKPESTTALLVGSYVDSYFDGSLPQFIASHPEIMTIKGELRADYKQAERIIQRIESDAVFMEYMKGEKQRIFTGELFGCEWKIKVDVYHPERIVDLKIMRSLEPVMGKSFIEHWLYDVQMAVYSAVEGRKKETYLAVATKEDVTDIEVIHIPEWRRSECLNWIEILMPHILDIKTGIIEPKRCGVCDYCRSTKVLTGPIDFQDVGISNYELNRMKGEY